MCGPRDHAKEIAQDRTDRGNNAKVILSADRYFVGRSVVSSRPVSQPAWARRASAARWPAASLKASWDTREKTTMATTSLSVNGRTVSITVDDSDTPLLYVLRNELGLHGPRFGCGLGQCGACTVHVDGTATRSC